MRFFKKKMPRRPPTLYWFKARNFYLAFFSYDNNEKLNETEKKKKWYFNVSKLVLSHHRLCFYIKEIFRKKNEELAERRVMHILHVLYFNFIKMFIYVYCVNFIFARVRIQKLKINLLINTLISQSLMAVHKGQMRTVNVAKNSFVHVNPVHAEFCLSLTQISVK